MANTFGAVRLDTQGQRIAGTFDDSYTKVMRTKTGEVRYDVTYSFVVAGRTYHGSGESLPISNCRLSI
jgi:hypothetical protein